MGIASGITHLGESVLETIRGILAAIVNLFEFVFGGIVSVFSGFVNFVEGTLGFAFHNFFLLGTFAAVVLGYMLYTERKGTAPASRAVKS
ncbi:hypothetical protein F4803DRAFT_551825 [Xylaria telfairii]|nr:hypothetical protein F4803DRAFT_551825 [Xylaria telfairii]